MLTFIYRTKGENINERLLLEFKKSLEKFKHDVFINIFEIPKNSEENVAQSKIASCIKNADLFIYLKPQKKIELSEWITFEFNMATNTNITRLDIESRIIKVLVSREDKLRSQLKPYTLNNLSIVIEEPTP